MKISCFVTGHTWVYKDAMNPRKGGKEYQYVRTCVCKECNKTKIACKFEFGIPVESNY